MSDVFCFTTRLNSGMVLAVTRADFVAGRQLALATCVRLLTRTLLLATFVPVLLTVDNMYS